MIALEPEAASLYCKYLPMEKLEGSDGPGLGAFSPGCRYLVLDAGGNFFTIFFDVHQIVFKLIIQHILFKNILRIDKRRTYN